MALLLLIGHCCWLHPYYHACHIPSVAPTPVRNRTASASNRFAASEVRVTLAHSLTGEHRDSHSAGPFFFFWFAVQTLSVEEYRKILQRVVADGTLDIGVRPGVT